MHRIKLNNGENLMPLIKNTLVAAALLTVIVSMTVFIPAESNMAVFSVSASPYFSTEGFTKLTFGFYTSEAGAFGSTIVRDDFDSGVTVSVNTGFVGLSAYANVSATRYSASPTLNTWINMTIVNPTGITSYTAQYKVDSAYAYNSTDGYLGAGYNADAEYYVVARTFSFSSITLTEGVWLIYLTIYTS
ncbi:MAG: hypothetical protein ABFD50_06640 [Smithella sp.]